MRRYIVNLGVAVVVACLIFCCYVWLPFHEDRLMIGATYMTLNNRFFNSINEQVEKEVDIRSDQLIVREPSLSIDKQVEEIHEMIKDGIDALIINPVDGNSKAISQALKDAKVAGVKVIVVDTPMYDDRYVDTTIVSNNYRAGCLDAKCMMKNQKSARIFLLEHRTAISAVDRIRGFLDTIKGHKNYRVVARANCYGQTLQAMKESKKFLKKKIHFDTLMSLNDPSALGALAAFDEANLSGINIYSVDGSPDLKGIIASNKFVCVTAAQFPLSIGTKAVQAAYALIKGKKVDHTIDIPVTLITKENVAKYSLTGWQ